MPLETELYNEAGILYCKVASGICNLKNGLFQSNFNSNLKKILAIVAEAIKNKAIINEIFKRSRTDKGKSTKKSKFECSDGTGCFNCRTKVQIYDMLFGQATSNTSGCPLISKMRFYKNILDEIMKELKLNSKEEALEHFRPNDKSIELPVYVRINTVLITREEAVEHFQANGYKYLFYEDKSVKYNQFLEWVKELNEMDFMPDFHVHDHILVFHHSVSLHNDKLVQSRKVLIQDKASCIPAVILNPEPDMDVIDACAAPGNKTSHILAILSEKEFSNNPVTLFAFDRDEKRFQLLQNAMAPYKTNQSISDKIVIDEQHEDFTKIDPADPKYANVGYICLDPSCSGSGIMRQVDRVAERNNNSRIDQHRLNSLKNFQAMLLSHALSFPNVKRVVYSTCSVTLDENESVVEEIMNKFGTEFALRPIWMENWMTRGKKNYKECLRTNPTYDYCNGFFVSCFERIAPSVEGAKSKNRPKIDKDKAGAKKTETTVEVVGKKYRKRRKTKKTGKKARDIENKKAHLSKVESEGNDELQKPVQTKNNDMKENPVNTEESEEKSKKKHKKNKVNSDKGIALSEQAENVKISVKTEDSEKKRKKHKKNENEEGKAVAKETENVIKIRSKEKKRKMKENDEENFNEINSNEKEIISKAKPKLSKKEKKRKEPEDENDIVHVVSKKSRRE